ncbi:hypothetical protein NL64_06385 [Pseudomonas fluorescens]|uniref:deoxynucleotide monophosphate kinase family protein n=1 Tax=Pseudomonas fluorescens TaxID=294 RepID=UPI00054B753A|nr:hypothetical protein [Pseudomonas fluorescens]KII34883.1 hypothetical protein NL64_06385 [Pseudomonas fluorescens]
MNLIGLIGKARVGKDTAAEHLHMWHMFNRYAFAAPLKDMLSAAFGHDIGEADGAAKEQVIDWLGKSPRQLTQLLGTEWGRNCVHPQLWTLLAEQQWIHCQRGLSHGLVISDVRFDNEAEWILQQGGTLIEITRGTAAPVNAHASEAGVHLRYPRFMVSNDGTLDELYSELDRIVFLLPTNTRIAS